MEAQERQSAPSEREALQAIEQGIKCLKDNQDDRAIECLTEAIRLNPECVRAYRLRGQIYRKTGDWAKAERDLSKARRAEARQQRSVDH